MITLTPERELNIRRSFRVAAIALLVAVSVAIVSNLFCGLGVPYLPA